MKHTPYKIKRLLWSFYDGVLDQCATVRSEQHTNCTGCVAIEYDVNKYNADLFDYRDGIYRVKLTCWTVNLLYMCESLFLETTAGCVYSIRNTRGRYINYFKLVWMSGGLKALPSFTLQLRNRCVHWNIYLHYLLLWKALSFACFKETKRRMLLCLSGHHFLIKTLKIKVVLIE